MPSFFEGSFKEGRGIMAYFNVCDKCGAHLDPGEVCDCNSKREVLRKKYEELVILKPRRQQMVLNIKK
ncbi:MAG: hypothetical protein IJ272_05650 [Clostridia bacterium]|nr:hypothetical protein [Clostridia bacterium]